MPDFGAPTRGRLITAPVPEAPPAPPASMRRPAFERPDPEPDPQPVSEEVGEAELQEGRARLLARIHARRDPPPLQPVELPPLLDGGRRTEPPPPARVAPDVPDEDVFPARFLLDGGRRTDERSTD